MADPRITQYRVSSEDINLTGPKRSKEISSLSAYLHKHQNDDLTGPSRQALSHAIEKHRSHSPAGCESMQLLLECALKMPEKIFGKSEKMRFLKWLESTPGGDSGSDATKEVEGEVAQRYILLDITEDGTLTLAHPSGELFEEKVVRVVKTEVVRALTMALEGSSGDVGVWINSASGEMVRFDAV